MNQALGLLATALLAFAPVPQNRPTPPLEIVEGDWVMRWGASADRMPLTRGGSYSWGDGWVGTYSWDPKTRVFAVQETPKGGDRIYRWRVTLDAEGRGTSEGDDFAGAKVEIRRAAVELLPPPKVDF